MRPRPGKTNRPVVLVLPSSTDPAHRRVADSLAPLLSKSGFKTTVFAPSPGITPGTARKKLASLLSREPAGICHIQFFSRGLGWLLPARFPQETRVVLTHQGASLALMEHPQAFHALARRAAAVTTVSRAGLRELVAAMPWIRSKSCVIPNGTDLPKKSRTMRTESPRKRGNHILCVSRLAAYKGTDILVMAFAGLLARGHDLDLVIAGPDQTQGAITRLIRRLGLSDRIHLPGTRTPGQVSRLLADCLFFVLPSRKENMPMALLEAMAQGKAVIASRVGGIPEAVRHDKDGLLVRAGDATGLTKAMERLAQDQGLRLRLGRRAAASAERSAWSAIARRYRRLYYSLE
ncbi:MAG: glycosyltransferase family 4 protein [Elusimicrobia bacterium]|nr:glycosyltransferase family 4 protein [Elusimicrobiota bacterium]